MKKRRLVLLSTAVGIAGLAGCATAPKPTSQASTIQCAVPVITAMPETKQSQEKGGVEIAIVPTLYKSARADKKTVTQVKPPSDLTDIIMRGDRHAGQVYVEEKAVPGLVTQPGRLEFVVRINNKLPRVFKGQGSVVQFNVAGKLIPFGDTDYRDFINGLVPPRNEVEFKIYGPALDMLPDKGTIGIFLYDVVTATDAAGNTTEKQNFEWYYNYATQVVQENVETQINQKWIPVSEYQQIMLKEQVQEHNEMLRTIGSQYPVQR